MSDDLPDRDLYNVANQLAEEHVVQPARFAPLQPHQAEKQPAQSIEFLFDVNLHVTVELGRTEMTVRKILEMGPGTVVELNRLAGEAVDVLVNGRAIARGEVVVIDDMFGVRVTDILSPYDRINSLR
jgi:flagellar motor switch protein FliN/FliY